MTDEASAAGRRVLISAPFGRDAESVSLLLRDEGYDVHVCTNLADIAGRLDETVGAVLLTEEALEGDAGKLKAVLAEQPSWSDMPFVMLAAQRAARVIKGETTRIKIFELATNTVVMERPLGRASLVSAVASALRSRRKQFEIRDRLSELSRRNLELAASEKALRDSDDKFQAIANSIDQMIWSTLPDGFHDYYNDRWYEYTGMTPGSTDGEAWNGMFHPDDQERAWALWRHSLRTGEPYEIEYRLRHHSGEYQWVLGRAQAMRDASGTITRWFGTCTEIQDLIAAREVLSRSREQLEGMVKERTQALEGEMTSRTRAEEALHQMQKMEAVGHLTGGIAHDFNNMLTGVIGSLEITKRRIAAGRVAEIDRFIDTAMSSAERAAALTARLLAFSRRQSLDAKPVDINALALSLEELLRRTIPENISLKIAPGVNVPFGVVDANQLENAILNLVINARDAMPDGGLLTIETSSRQLSERDVAETPEIKAGRFVVLSVTDTGVGMSPEILKKVFEPFFTTKPIGQGTGLGLSMLYGFARQSGGQVRVHSRVGEGTSVSIYIPAGEQLEQAASIAEAVEPRHGLGQTVLVIEDDPSVRLLICEVLAELSYRAIEAFDADTAIPILASDQVIHLLVSDVGLPGMNGRQLAEVARQYRPQLPILFVTGYAENAAIRAGFLGTNMDMISKPFSVEILGTKIDEMISISSLEP